MPLPTAIDYLGDWEHAAVPLQGLLSPAYTHTLAQLITSDGTATGIADRVEPWSYYLDRACTIPGPSTLHSRPANPATAAMAANGGATTHINVVDKDRNAVSCTHTGFWGPVHPYNTGVYLTGGMAWFIPLPGHANSIAPWKRPMNNMCPVMVFQDGRPVACQARAGSAAHHASWRAGAAQHPATRHGAPGCCCCSHCRCQWA